MRIVGGFDFSTYRNMCDGSGVCVACRNFCRKGGSDRRVLASFDFSLLSEYTPTVRRLMCFNRIEEKGRKMHGEGCKRYSFGFFCCFSFG